MQKQKKILLSTRTTINVFLDLLKVFYNTKSDNKTFKHSTHTLKITKATAQTLTQSNNQ